ncbi:hypothetical protein Y032_1486g3895, partial [Ancylostoma ceylanicum]
MWVCARELYSVFTVPAIFVLASVYCICSAPTLCRPYFSEVSTLYLGTGVQSIEEEFIELAFSEAACGKQSDASLRDYHLAVIDTRPRTSTSAITLFYASLYHQKLKNSWYFLIGKGNDDVTTDLPYSEETYTFEVNGIQRRALEGQGIDALFENPSASEELSHYPVVFVLFKKPTAAMERKKVTEACETISYCVRGPARKTQRRASVVILSKLEIIDAVFQN